MLAYQVMAGVGYRGITNIDLNAAATSQPSTASLYSIPACSSSQAVPKLTCNRIKALPLVSRWCTAQTSHTSLLSRTKQNYLRRFNNSSNVVSRVHEGTSNVTGVASGHAVAAVSSSHETATISPATKVGGHDAGGKRGSDGGGGGGGWGRGGGDPDVVVIGAGIGGLCCGALLARYGYDVVVCESHSVAGGVAHSFKRGGYQFDVGPSFHAGLSMKRSINPLKQVLDALEEHVDFKVYNSWMGNLPEGQFEFVADKPQYLKLIENLCGADAVAEWMELENRMAPIAHCVEALPAAAVRSDIGAVLTLGRTLPQLLKALPGTSQMLKPFSAIVDEVVKNKSLRRLIDFECFVLSGLTADSTLSAEMAMMYFERHRPEGTIDYPMGGGAAIIDALVRGLEKHGGRLMLNTHVDQILIEDGKATGVVLRPRGSKSTQGGSGTVIRARKAVVSNASVWDTARLLPAENRTPEQHAFIARAAATPFTDSFMHLHLGFDATGLPPDLACHHFVVYDWEAGVMAPQNVVLISIPSVFDPSLAPPGKHALHAYVAAGEPYSLWENMDRRSKEYKEFKMERSQVLWKSLERIIPDIRERVDIQMVGTPLTQERYTRRSRGTYGPAIDVSKAMFPGPASGIPSLLCCGDSTAPGIGVPAAAASGMMAANALVPVWQHWGLLDSIEKAAQL